ncbi:hypothetical protein OF83DRAFT_373223 [Amylostereum chailletii]|nr:hypothetical protein OF83DRAFT_373223 [Amylostereum chailletii]
MLGTLSVSSPSSLLLRSLAERASASVTVSTSTLPHYAQTRGVSSSPYGRSHVWRHRPRKLPNPVVPQFPQKVIRSDGSSFIHWTTSPRSLLRLTRDVTNAPVWNISILTGEGAQEESATTGRLGRFNRRFAQEEVDWMAEAEGPDGPAPVKERAKVEEEKGTKAEGNKGDKGKKKA